MILIADSGSTKTHWCLVTDDGQRHSYATQGLNPYFHTEESVVAVLQTELLAQIKQELKPLSIYFYGAGCGLSEINQILINALSAVFDIKNIEVNNDLLAAARALCGNKQGIVAIMGTGSNTCYYNGNVITEKRGGLGYVLGDEGSGAYLGKTLMQDYLNDDMPEHIKKQFDSTFNLTQGSIIDSVYKKPMPNRFFASFSKFIHANIADVYFYNLVHTSFDLFFEKNICKYTSHKSDTLHCVGSVAYNYKDILAAVALKRGVVLGNITDVPIYNLVSYHCR